MILTDSSAANVGATAVTAIASATPSTLQFMCYAATKVIGAQLGSLNLEKNGSGTLELNAALTTHTGAIKINEGSFVIGNVVILNGVISGAGQLTKINGLTTLTLGASNTYSGGTTFNGGTITYNSSNAFGTGTFVSLVGGTVQTANNVTLPNDFVSTASTLQFRTLLGNTIIVSGNISGAGNLNKTGNGNLNLDGTLTYTGSTNVQAGFIRA